MPTDTGSPNNNALVPYRIHSKFIIRLNPFAVIPTDFSIANSRLRKLMFVEIVLKKFIPSLHKSLGVYLPLITTNCAVLGVTINNITAEYNFFQSMISSLGVGLGFLLAMVLFAGVRSRIENCPAPKCFKGVPITLISASIVALAFYGFAGVVENLLKI